MSEELKRDLNSFFEQLEHHAAAYVEWTSEVPKIFVVNPDIIGRLSREEGFFQRPELRALVPAHSPMVRYIRLNVGVVTIREDWDEKFYHFE